MGSIHNWIFKKGTQLRRKRKSVVFLHGSYYNFFYLAIELRKRGWEAKTVGVDSPNHPSAKLKHGEDVNLFSSDPKMFRRNIDRMFRSVKRNFAMVHFYGIGRMSFYPENWDRQQLRSSIPWDFLELKKSGLKIGYTHCGCMDMVGQTTFNLWSGGVCNKCVWQKRPDVCGDLINHSWGVKVQTFCDVICSESEPLLDYKSGPKVVREPMTFAISPEVWDPQMSIPAKFKIERFNGETLIYHGVANYAYRSNEERNIKGTPSLVRAIENLKARGHKVRLIFVTDIPSKDVRYLQAQCDIVVDQLNYGRFGATAREGMMLGKPTVGAISEKELVGRPPQCLLEAPIVRADEENIEAKIEELITKQNMIADIGIKSREYAIKWWSPGSCADRFEEVFDRLQKGFAPTETSYVFETNLRP